MSAITGTKIVSAQTICGYIGKQQTTDIEAAFLLVKKIAKKVGKLQLNSESFCNNTLLNLFKKIQELFSQLKEQLPKSVHNSLNEQQKQIQQNLILKIAGPIEKDNYYFNLNFDCLGDKNTIHFLK